MTGHCIICGETSGQARFVGGDERYRTTDETFTVLACSSCGMMRLSPMPTPEQIRSFYPQSYWFAPDKKGISLAERYRRLVLRDHVRFVVQALREYEGKGRLLDVGCGGGLFLGMMKERGWDVVGLDFSAEASEVALKSQGVHVEVGSIEQAPFAPESFTAITMFHVLEHLVDPGTSLAAARKLLKPGGKLVVQVPDAGTLGLKLFGIRWNALDIPRHLYHFRSKDLERLLEAQGFHVVRRKHFSLRDDGPGILASMFPALDPTPRNKFQNENPTARLLKDALALVLSVASLPFAIFSAGMGAGVTIMIEARRD
jgi:SAM-dependent methyltransferase